MKKLVTTAMIIAVSAVAIAIIVYVGLLGFGYFLVVRDPLVPSDAVAVLSGGGPERLEYGVQLVISNTARRLIITETGEVEPASGALVSRIAEDRAAQLGIRKVYIYRTKQVAISTFEEAQAVLELAKDREWEKIVVVTDVFHSRRTKVIFSDVFRGSGIQIRVNPVNLEGYWYHPSSWWMQKDSRQATIQEYIKLVSYLLGIKRS